MNKLYRGTKWGWKDSDHVNQNKEYKFYIPRQWEAMASFWTGVEHYPLYILALTSCCMENRQKVRVRYRRCIGANAVAQREIVVFHLGYWCGSSGKITCFGSDDIYLISWLCERLVKRKEKIIIVFAFLTHTTEGWWYHLLLKTGEWEGKALGWN